MFATKEDVPSENVMRDAIVAFDWATTPLGPADRWPERLKVMVEQVVACPVVSSLVCGPDRILIYNDAAARNYGSRHPGALGRPLPETFPEGWAAVGQLYERAFRGESVHVPGQRLDVDGAGRISTFDAVLTPVGNDDGSVAYVHMTGWDVTQRVEETARRLETMEILIGELKHRARNSYTIIQALAHETAREIGSTREFTVRFGDRIAGLARVQDLLTLRDDETVSVRDLLEMELEAHGADTASGRIVLDGPDARLDRDCVQPLALAIHELSTNARKYGAIANPEGRLSVKWRISREQPKPLLRLEWNESGCRTPVDDTLPARSGGYGRKLIEEMLPRSLGATTNYGVDGNGVRCVVSFPYADPAGGMATVVGATSHGTEVMERLREVLGFDVDGSADRSSPPSSDGPARTLRTAEDAELVAALDRIEDPEVRDQIESLLNDLNLRHSRSPSD